jgi:tRNA (guanine-N7-)-methyltransferase
MPRERGHLNPDGTRYVLTLPPAGPPPACDLLNDSGTPLEVDLGCGRGRFLLARARRFPAHRFVGVDRMLLRLHKLDRRLAAEGIANVRLVYGDAVQALGALFAPGSVAALYLFFPDPWPKRRHRSRRLVSPPFLDRLHVLLGPGGAFHFATDHADYFEAAVRTVAADPRFAPVPAFEPLPEEQTDFEVLFRRQAQPVHRASWSALEPGFKLATVRAFR